MSKFCPLFSSSSGNCIYIGDSDRGILIDAGVSFKSICEALSKNDIDIATIKAVAVTHEHIDHKRGLRPLIKKLGIPVIASAETLTSLKSEGIIPEGHPVIEIETTACVDGICVTRIPTCHDCKGSSAYVIAMPDERRYAVCTDLGCTSDDIVNGISGCDLVMLESNHDINMLKNGSYPPATKLRILSDHGHLSNGACACLLPQLVKSGTTRLVLGHLSQHNNLPALALSSARAELLQAGLKDGIDYILYIAPVKDGRMFYL